MIEMSGHLMQLLVQRTAKSDVHLLEPAADAEYWHPRMHRPPDEGQCGRVPRRIVQRPGLARDTLVALRLNVRGAAGEEQSVETLDELVESQLLGKCGDQYGRGARRFEHGTGIFLPHHVKWVRTDHAPVGGDSNQRAGGCHGGRVPGERLIS